MNFDIDPREINLQGPDGMQLVKLLRKLIAAEDGGGGDEPVPTESTGIFYCTYGTTNGSEIAEAITNELLPVCIYGNAYYYLISKQYGIYYFANIDRVNLLLHRITCNGRSWSQSTKALQEVLDFDYIPTEGSTNPVTSGGVYTAIQQSGGGSDIYPYQQYPAMDGTASPGSSDNYARGDHVHPTDTSRAAASDITRIDAALAGKADQASIQQTIEDTVDDWLTVQAPSIGTLSYAAKQALLACFRKVAWIDNQGQSYYDALESELFPDATLQSISAVFTQGTATIYNTDSLDTLRQYLVVTATYSDNTTEIVNSYTLSGTLTEGTSTITVSYGGKTDTFSVVVTENPIPAGYTVYDYIYNKNTSSNDISLDTQLGGEFCGTNYEHELTFLVTNAATSTSYPLYGLRVTTGSDPRARALWTKETADGNLACNYNGVDTGFVFNMATNTKYKCVTGNGQWKMNDVIVQDNMDGSSYNPPSTGTIRIFGIQTGSTVRGGYTRHNMKVYGFKVTDLTTNTVVAEFVPVMDSSDTAGLYDIVNARFCTAIGSATIGAGND